MRRAIAACGAKPNALTGRNSLSSDGPIQKARGRISARLLLGYYTDDGKLIYAGRVGTGMPEKVLKDLRRRLDPLQRPKSPLSAPPPRTTRFGSPLVLSRVHWVEPTACRRDHLFDLDRRQPVAADGLCRAAGGQAGRAGAARVSRTSRQTACRMVRGG